MDQSLFAAPHGLSQRITSFIACACQGIHQLPLRHLIVLIANDHRSSTHFSTAEPFSPACLQDQLLETCGMMRGQQHQPFMNDQRLPNGHPCMTASSQGDDPRMSSLHYVVKNRRLAQTGKPQTFFV
jgi:hypothetical protein